MVSDDNEEGLPNPIEDSDQKIYKCRRECSCGYSDKKTFDPVITYLGFQTKYVWSDDNKCPKCGERLLAIEEDENQRLTKAELVLDIAEKNIEKLFVDEYQEAHAAITLSDHLETVPLKSRRFRNYLANAVYKEYQTVIDSNTLKDAIGILSAKAMFDKSSETIKLNLRVAESDGKWYYDLTNKDWEFVEIDSIDWKIVNNLVLFHRYNNQLPQVYPSREYPKDIFDKFIALVLNETNVEDEKKLAEYRIIAKCYIICGFIAGFPKAISMPNGTQGAAKTTFMERKKMLIDPCVVRTLSFPRDINELIQQLSHNYVAFYDNISELKSWISDELCRAVTGSGSSKRVLYSDDNDFIRSFKRCIGLNGINLAATKADILDRSIFFKLKRIDDKDRRDIIEIEKEFEVMRPQLLGYIMDILVKVKKWMQDNELKLASLPRMADWARHCEIIAICMGHKPGEFLGAYKENTKIQTEQVMETSLVATCMGHFVETDPRFNGDGSLAMLRGLDGNTWGWVGIASKLKTELEVVAAKLNIDVKTKGWPRTPSYLTLRLNEIIHTLKEAGIEIDYERSGHSGRKHIKIRKIASAPLVASANENHAQNSPKIADAMADAIDTDRTIASANSRSADGADATDATLHTFREQTSKNQALSLLYELDVRNLIKCEGTHTGDKLVYDANPATGILYVTDNNPSFISGELRMRGKDGGRYPYNYLEMIEQVFGAETNTIEVCSRSVKGINQGSNCFTVDINPDCNPDLVADGQKLSSIPDNTYDRWRCDPPYNERTARDMYNTELPSTSKLLKEAARICKPGSLMFLLLSQNYQHCPDGVKRIGRISISVVPNNEERILNIFYKLADTNLSSSKAQINQEHVNVHRLHGDIWGCDSCNYRQDRHFFDRSSCSRNKKQE